ncbi:hypothetical protein V5799_032059 [Amblyomma americanum]|uniref:Uncharacterized protein n=1 Tax=Amblyomma americanum TaxID=6943 RepID=A0AAQ4DS94_AMBAM
MAIIVLLSIYEKSPQHRVETAHFCCPDVLNHILSGANLSIDPCRSIFGRTCYAYVSTPDVYIEPSIPSTDPVDGVPITEAGRAIAAYYRACVMSPNEADVSLGKISAKALVNVIDPPGTSTLTAHSLVAVLVNLSLEFGLPSVIEFGISGGMGSAPYLSVSVPSLHDDPATSRTQSSLETLKVSALEAVNEALSSKISMQEVDALTRDVGKAKTDWAEKHPFEFLGNITLEITAVQWKELMAKYNPNDGAGVSEVSFQLTKENFADLLKPKNQQQTLVSALVVASVKLALVLDIDANNSEARAQTCRSRAKELRTLIILDRIGNLHSGYHDDAIRNAYDIIADAVLRKVLSGMEKEDFSKLKEALKGMRVLLPSEIVPALLAIPTMTSEYAHAELMARAYVIKAQRHQAFVLSISNDSLDDFQKNHVTIDGGRVTVPTQVYTIVMFGSVTEPLLMMPTVGVYLADALWQFIFTSNWSTASNASLGTYRGCIEKNSRSLIEWPSQLLWLSVQSSLEATKDAQWDVAVDTAGTWNTTRGQLFYITFVHYLLCHAPHSKYPTFGTDVDVFMSAFEDFYRSFKCNATVSKITGAVCSLHL